MPPHLNTHQPCLRTLALATCRGDAGALETQLEKCELTPGYKKGDFLQARMARFAHSP